MLVPRHAAVPRRRRDARLLQVALAGAWGLALAAVALLVLRRAWLGAAARRAPVLARLLLWTVVAAAPLAYASVVRPCLTCHDLVAVLMHEVGHLPGLGHPTDAAPGACGCGANASAAAAAAGGACAGRAAGDAVMHAVALRRPRACLGRDDADAARTLYGGDCAAPVRRYDGGADRAGYARIAVALVYAFLAGWLVVALREACAPPVAAARAPPVAPRADRARSAVVRARPVVRTRPVLRAIVAPQDGPRGARRRHRGGARRRRRRFRGAPAAAAAAPPAPHPARRGGKNNAMFSQGHARRATTPRVLRVVLPSCATCSAGRCWRPRARGRASRGGAAPTTRPAPAP